MSKVAKRITQVLIGLVALVVCLVLAAWVWIDFIVKTGIQEGGHYAMGVPTKVDTVSLSLLKGTFSMEQLDIGNPAGFITPHLMKAGKFNLAVDSGSVLSPVIKIPKFELDGLDINIEETKDGTNMSVVMGNIQKLGGAKDSAPAAQPSEKKPEAKQPETKQPEAKGSQEKKQDSGKKVRVDYIAIRNVVAHFRLAGIAGAAGPITVRVPLIELRDIGTDKEGVSIGQLMGQLTPAIMASILETGKGILPTDFCAKMGKDVAATATALGGKAGDLVKQAGAGAAQALEAGANVLKNGLEGATKGADKSLVKPLESLLGGKKDESKKK